MCLLLVASWALVTAWQAIAVFPWDQGGAYGRAYLVVSGTADAVIVVVLAEWLLSASRLLRSS